MVAIPWWFTALFAGFLGAALGSFLNVVVGRLPYGQPLTGRSHCPRCQHPIRDRHNIPLWGWLVLRGRCADCQGRISPRYPLVEGFTAAAFIAVTLTFGYQPYTAVLLIFVCMSIALALIDWETMRLPNNIVLTVGPVVIAGSLLSAYVDKGIEGVYSVLWGIALVTGVYGTLWLVTLGRGLGLGDVKLAPTLGAVTGYLGITTSVVSLAAAWIIGASVAIVGLIAGFVKPRRPFPFGPYLLMGTWVAIFFSQSLAQAYMNVAFP